MYKNKFNSLKEVYEACKDLVEGKIEFILSENKHDEYIDWKFNENISFYIDGDYFEINSKYLHTHYHPDFDYNEIYNSILKYNEEFKLNPNYGKKTLKNYILSILSFILFLFIMVLSILFFQILF